MPFAYGPHDEDQNPDADPDDDWADPIGNRLIPTVRQEADGQIGPVVVDHDSVGCIDERSTDAVAGCVRDGLTAGAEPALRYWVDSGFTTAQAAAWLDAGYASPTAAGWTAIGVDTPAVAQQWIDAGFTVQSAAVWVEVPDMAPSEAARCANGGLSPVDVERVRRADPGWTRPEPQPGVPEPGWGIQT